jgi:predicted nucleic acid-binding protein
VSALVVDTSSWVSYLAGRGSALVEPALEDGRLHVPPVVAAELLSGHLSPRQRRDLQALLDDLPLVAAGRDHWYRVGRLRSSLRVRGLTVSTPDAHVAQCALDLDATVLSEDRIFSRIAQHAALRIAG